MATPEEIARREEFNRFVRDFESKISGIVNRVDTRERARRTSGGTVTAEESASEQLRRSQKEQGELTERIKNYSKEMTATTRVMQTVRESLGKFNSATLNAVTSIFSTLLRDTQDIGFSKLKLERKDARVSELQAQKILEAKTAEETKLKTSVFGSDIIGLGRQIDFLRGRGFREERIAQRREGELKEKLTEAGITIDPGKTAMQTLNLKLKEITGKELKDLTSDELKSTLQQLNITLTEQEKKVSESNTEYEKETKARNDLQQEIQSLNFARVANALNSVANAFQELVGTIRKTQQQFGITASQAASVKFGNLAQSIDSYISAILPGGKSGAPVSRQQIAGVQQAFQTEFGGVLTSTAARRIAQRGVEEGITPEQQAAARRAFMTITGDRERAVAAETKFIQTFKDANLTSKDAMEAASKYSELIARNGTRFGDAFARAAKEAKQIGVDLTKIDQFGDNIINNFEGFLESQAELGAMGFGFDTSRLAEIAATGNTEALQRELQSQLQTTGKNLEQLSRPERLSLESALGMTIGDIQKLAKGKASGESIEDLTKKSNTFLDKSVNFLSSVAAGISGLASLLGIANAFLLMITRNTGMAAGLTGKARFLPAGGFGAPAMAGMGTLGKLGMVGLGAGAGLGGAMLGRSMVEKGNTGLGIGLGALGGGLGLALALAPFTGGMSLVAAGLAGAAAGGLYAAGGRTGDDVVSKPGYGERVLVTPTATVALNNQDNVVAYADDMVAQEAGLKLLSKGAITSTTTPDLSSLEKVFERNIGQLRDSFDRMASAPQQIKIYMDGKEVGKGIYNNTEKAQSMEVFGIPSRATY